jgi:hypothetical protein
MRWYDSRQRGLGDDFLLCAGEAIARICRNPEMFAIVHRDVRQFGGFRTRFSIDC